MTMNTTLGSKLPQCYRLRKIIRGHLHLKRDSPINYHTNEKDKEIERDHLDLSTHVLGKTYIVEVKSNAENNECGVKHMGSWIIYKGSCHVIVVRNKSHMAAYAHGI